MPELISFIQTAMMFIGALTVGYIVLWAVLVWVITRIFKHG